MKYPLQPTPPRPLAKVLAGNGSDARWRDVDERPELWVPCVRVPGVIRIDSTRRHELAKTARKS